MKKAKTHAIGQAIDHFKPRNLHILISLLGLFVIAITTIALAAITTSNNQYGYGLETSSELYVRIQTGNESIRNTISIPILNNEITIYGDTKIITGALSITNNVFIPTKTTGERIRFRDNPPFGIEVNTGSAL